MNLNIGLTTNRSLVSSSDDVLAGVGLYTGTKITTYPSPEGERLNIQNVSKKLVRIEDEGQTIFLEPGEYHTTWVRGELPRIDSLNNGL
jgi:hypothetical protein